MKITLPYITRAAALVGVCLSSACSVPKQPRAAPPAGTVVTGAVKKPQMAVTIKSASNATATLIPATSTPIALAAVVNDQPITLEQLHTELAHYLDTSAPNDPQAAEAQKIVLSNMIQRTLLQQEAQRLGITASDAQIDEAVSIARARAGGDEAYVTWLAASHLTPEEVRERIRIALLTAAVRDRIVAAVPRRAEHVHAFHILVATELEAQQMLDQLAAGAVFGPLAMRFSLDEGTRADEGDLGWFPQGADAVIWPEVEEAAFKLPPGETSNIIASPAGFHIVRVVAREMRPLSEANFTALQQRALEAWMSNMLAQSHVERFL